MEKKEMTKGYALLVGEIYGIDNKEPRKTQYRNELNVRIKTSKNNSLFVKVGGFLSSRTFRTAKSNTSFNPSLVFAEHSTYPNA